jgi:hypothetical protein
METIKMKVKQQLYETKEFKKLTRLQMYDLWFRQSLTEKSIALLFGVTREQVKEKREGFGLGFLESGIASLSGTPEYRDKTKLIPIKPPKDWDGKLMKLPKIAKDSTKHRKENKDILNEVLGEQEDKKARAELDEEKRRTEERRKAAAEEVDFASVNIHPEDDHNEEFTPPNHSNELEIDGKQFTISNDID